SYSFTIRVAMFKMCFLNLVLKFVSVLSQVFVQIAGGLMMKRIWLLYLTVFQFMWHNYSHCLNKCYTLV
ncbi:MAG: hypothetical protein EBR82_53955, partial [Caulobacteraceae bacterium]|nr:hypothetical protein [Caulobacteraceae bacterium]